MIDLLCDKPNGCQDCHGQFDVSEVQNRKEDPHEPKKNKPRYTLNAQKPIKVLSTREVIECAKDVFTGVGKLKGYQYKIEIDKSVSPVVMPPRWTPDKVQADLNLDDMEKTGVIEKQHNATERVSSPLCTPNHMRS